MRFLVKVRLPGDTSQPLGANSNLRKAMAPLLDKSRVEALFFGQEFGQHCIFLILTVSNASRLTALVKPLRETLGAEVEFMPAADPEFLPFMHRAVS